MSLYQYWLDNGVKVFSLQFNFLRPSIYDFKTDEYDPPVFSNAQKVPHYEMDTKFLQHTKPLTFFLSIDFTVHNDKSIYN